MVADKPMLKDVLPGFFDWCKGDILVAQNHTFDMGFVVNACRLLRLPYPGNEVMDTMLLSKELFPAEKANLDVMLARHNIPGPEKRHRALDDALVTAKLFIVLLNLIRDKGWDPFKTIKPASNFKV